MSKTGVFICHCGSNIAGVVAVEKVVESAKTLPGVKVAMDYKYMCSDPGQNLIINTIKEQALDRVVVGSCSPRMHENTFRMTIERAGLNPYRLEIANLREHVSWVHSEKASATDKAIKLVELAVAKVRRNEPLQKIYAEIEKRALVIGGGIAGIQAALDIAANGYKVTLVEREPSIGGRMSQLDKTFPTMDCSACILTPKMVAVAQNKDITLLTYAEVEQVHGYVGNFEVNINKKARFVSMTKCIGCGVCTEKCPSKKRLSEFNANIATRKAIYTPFPQAVPNIPVIDKDSCMYFATGKCKVCEKVCPAGAVDYTQEDEIITEKFGAIVVATGYDLYDHSSYGEYGYGEIPDVITGLQLERMINSGGPTGGHIKRPSDGKEPETVVFIQCVGSRDDAKGKPYCSRVCCMYTAKQALLLREHYPNSKAIVFYMDIRAAGKGYEEFIQRVQTEYGVLYLRGRVSRIYEKKDHLLVKGVDTLSGNQVEIKADMVVLATGLKPKKEAQNLAQLLHIGYDQNGFYTELHPKLAPVETQIAGVYLAGCCQSPKDIPDTVAQSSATAAKVGALLSKERLEIEPMISEVNPLLCSGCRMCYNACPYGAIEMEDTEIRRGEIRCVAKVLVSVCKGCGVCVAGCYCKAIDLKGWTDRQLMEQIKVISYC
jgi:heterodisulfide reductase subunit A